MNDFQLYFTLGRQHIADWQGIDHILFIAALSIRYQFSDWKQLLVLVTAFTIGHSITLALSVFNMVYFPTKWIEFLIPLTILMTAASNFFVKKFVFKVKFPFIYFFALFFGMIHGLGFSNYLKSLLGKNVAIMVQLLSFNLGLEVGQLFIVFGVLILGWIGLRLLKLNRREYLMTITGGIIALSIEMLIQRWPL